MNNALSVTCGNRKIPDVAFKKWTKGGRFVPPALQCPVRLLTTRPKCVGPSFEQHRTLRVPSPRLRRQKPGHRQRGRVTEDLSSGSWPLSSPRAFIPRGAKPRSQSLSRSVRHECESYE